MTKFVGRHHRAAAGNLSGDDRGAFPASLGAGLPAQRIAVGPSAPPPQRRAHGIGLPRWRRSGAQDHVGTARVLGIGADVAETRPSAPRQSCPPSWMPLPAIVKPTARSAMQADRPAARRKAAPPWSAPRVHRPGQARRRPTVHLQLPAELSSRRHVVPALIPCQPGHMVAAPSTVFITPLTIPPARTEQPAAARPAQALKSPSKTVDTVHQRRSAHGRAASSSVLTRWAISFGFGTLCALAVFSDKSSHAIVATVGAPTSARTRCSSATAALRPHAQFGGVGALGQQFGVLAPSSSRSSSRPARPGGRAVNLDLSDDCPRRDHVGPFMRGRRFFSRASSTRCWAGG